MDATLELEIEELKAELFGSFLLFVQTFFPLVTGREFYISHPIGRESHFITIAKALTKAARLDPEYLRLLINVAPGSGKSALVSMWVAWTMAKYPDSQYLYISYSHDLAAKHTEFIRKVIQCRYYAELFDVKIRSDSKAKDHFMTTAGGSVKAFGSASGVTGNDAGLPNLNRFSGAVLCFPFEELVHTEHGLKPIGELVNSKSTEKVYSVNLNTMEVELKPITGHYANPGSELIEVEFTDGTTIRCTPNHKIWTDSRGWVEAQHLSSLDKLPSPLLSGFVMDRKMGSHLNRRVIFDKTNVFFCKFFNFFKNFARSKFPGKFFPRFASIYLVNNRNGNVKLFCKNAAFFSQRKPFRNAYRLLSRYFCTRPFFMERKSAVPFCVRDILRLRSITQIFKQVVSTVSIKMPNLNSLFLRPKKSPSHGLMNHCKLNFAVLAKRDPVIPFPTGRNKGKLEHFFRYSNFFSFFSSAIFGNDSFFTSNPSHARDTIKSLIPRDRSPLFIRKIGHADKTYCLEVEGNHNFFVGLCKGVIVSNCDDLIKPDDAHSSTMRERVIRNYQETIAQRPRSEKVPIISIGQRVHEDDVSAFLLSGKDEKVWNKIVLKSIDDAGNAMYPEAQPLEMLLSKQEKSPYVFASQYQQDPIPSGGALFKEEYFPLLDEDPDMLVTFITADTAETSKTYNDATAFSFWGIYELEEAGVKTGQYGLHWIDALELRVEPKDLKDAFTSFYRETTLHKTVPTIAAIEKKSTGTTLCSVLSDFRGLQIWEIKRTASSGSKTARFLEAQYYIASKLVSLPRHGKHTRMCIDHMKRITANESHRHDDLADTLTDAIRLTFIEKAILQSVQGDNGSAIVKALNESNKAREMARMRSYGFEKY